MRKLLPILLLVLIVFMSLWHFVLPGIAERRINLVTAHEPYEPSAASVALHNDLYIADLHTDSLLWKRDILSRSNRGHVDLPRLIQANVALQVFTAVTKSPSGLNDDRNAADSDTITWLVAAQLWPLRTWSSLYERAAYQADKLSEFSAASDGALRFVKTADDLIETVADRAAGGSTVAAIYGIEGAHPLEGELSNLDRLFDRGLRVVGLTHFFDNELGGSLHGESGDGLTDFGRDVISRANELEMIIDIAHASPAMVEEVLTLSSRPVILSHGGMRSQCETPRNLDDDLMRKVAAAGGIIGIGFWNSAVCDYSPEGVARSIKRAVDVMGAEHVALGSDYDGAVEVMFTVDELAALTDALLMSGLSEADIARVMGSNVRDFFLRYLPGGS